MSHIATGSALDAATIDRAVGAVVASAAGDALGAPYEFDAPDPNAPCELEGGGHFGWEPGEWTDDTQMALAVLAVLAEGDADPEAIGTEMVRWYTSGPRDVGNQTRAVLGDAARHGSSPRAAAETFQQRRPDAAGNGALMRTGPVALAALGDREAVARLATAVAELTHPHPDSVEACVLWSLAIERAIITARPDQPFDWVAAVAAGLDHVDTGRRDLWRSRIDEAAGRDPTDFHHNNGWVVAAFQAALAAITATADEAHALPCDHLTAALRRVARSGGDTDTVAAIAGALLGARWGATAVPLTWRRRLHGRRIYGEPALTAADLDAMARLAVRGGRPDPSGWPGVDHLDYGTMPSPLRRARRCLVRQLRRHRQRRRRRRHRRRVAVPDGDRRRSAGGRAPHRRPHRHHRRRQPQRRVRPPRHRPDDRRPRRSRRAGVHPLRCCPAPCAIDGGGVPHHPRRRRRDGDRSGRRRPRRHADLRSCATPSPTSRASSRDHVRL